MSTYRFVWLAILLATISSVGNAQTFARVHNLNLGYAHGYAVDVTADGGLIVAGESQDGTQWGGWIARLHPGGSLLWQKVIATGANEFISGVLAAKDGGVVAAGQSGQQSGHLASSDGVWHAWIFKLDGSSSLLWQMQLETSFFQYSYASSVIERADGSYVVFGEYNDIGHVGDGWVIHLSATGQVLSQRAIDGGGYDRFTSAAATLDGGAIAAGWAGDSGGDSGIWVVKFDSSLNIEWQQRYNASGNDVAYSVRPSSDGAYFVGGTSNSFGTTSDDSVILKLDATGGLLWARRHDMAKNGQNLGWERLFSLWETPDGGVVAGGTRPGSPPESDQDAWALKLRGDGSQVWQRSFKGNADARFMAVRGMNDRSSVLVGQIGFSEGAWVMRIDQNGGFGIGCSQSATATSSTSTPTFNASSPTGVAYATNATITLPALTFPSLVATADAQCIGRPTEVSPRGALDPLRFTTPTHLVWEPGVNSNAVWFNLYRGDVANLGFGLFGVCLQSTIAAVGFDDPTSPSAGKAWEYLVSGRNTVGEGTLGFSSSGGIRPNGSPCP